MKTRILAFSIAALAVGAGAPAARSQDLGDAVLNRLVSWVTGDPAVAEQPLIDTTPKNYAEDTCCADGSCGCCRRCCCSHDLWGSVEFLMWWGKGTTLPPLVTTSPQGTPFPQAGVLGQPDTSVLFGNQLGGNGMQTGGRVTFGMWLDPQHNVAAGARYFGLGGDTTRFAQSSTGDPILARPFFNAFLGIQDSFVVAYPGFNQGSINARVTTNNIIGADAFTEIMMYRDFRRRVDLVGGYEFFRLDDWLQVNSSSTITDPINPFVGLNTALNDRFSTRNQFHGGLIGLRGRMAHGQWSLNVLGQVGLGNMDQQAVITGSTTTTINGNSTTTNGGLLARPSNIGTYQRDVFCAIPQLTANLHYHVNPNLSFHIGYNIIWITNMALSGDQVDLQVNLNQPVGPARPQFVFNDRDYWLQGINWGMNWDF
jgi:putative beta barrel porin BBP7